MNRQEIKDYLYNKLTEAKKNGALITPSGIDIHRDAEDIFRLDNSPHRQNRLCLIASALVDAKVTDLKKHSWQGYHYWHTSLAPTLGIHPAEVRSIEMGFMMPTLHNTTAYEKLGNEIRQMANANGLVE